MDSYQQQFLRPVPIDMKSLFQSDYSFYSALQECPVKLTKPLTRRRSLYLLEGGYLDLDYYL